MPRNYSTAEPAYVTMTLGTGTIKYGFKCRIQRDSAYTTLGITVINPTAITAALVQGLVLGANSPKPARASKLFDTVPPGYESTFCSDAQIAAAKADGWKIKPRTPSRAPTQSPRSKSVYVTINGLKYAWQFTKLLASIEGQVDLAGLGIQDATNADKDLVWGASFPKPPKAGKIVTDPEDSSEDRFTTFYDPSRSPLPAGYYGVAAKGSNLITADDLKSII